VVAGLNQAFAIGEGCEVFSWGYSGRWCLGHGDTHNQLSPKRVEALRGVRVSSVAIGQHHALSLTEHGIVYAWGANDGAVLLGNPQVEGQPLPKPVEALRGVRVGSIAAADKRSYAAADTGELWAWGSNCTYDDPVGHGEQTDCPLPKKIQSLSDIKMDAVVASRYHTLARADDGSVYAWGTSYAAGMGALGLGFSESAGSVPTPRRVPALRVACGP
jgi:E3 ubiquitin-protein ligase HERC2